jgi:transcription elongation factor GreA
MADLSANSVYLTKDGLATLEKELEQLKKVKLPKLVKRVAVARDNGDLSENAEYSSAREELSFLEGRLDELEDILAHAKIIKKTNGNGNKQVSLGSQITVKVNNGEHVFTIVGEWEADPMEKKISHDSPLGKALIGKKEGEEVEVEAPAGRVVYQIVKIH